MDLDRSLLKEFAKVVNDVGDKPEPKQYVYGTVTTGAGNTKCVMLDGSDTMTPISEVVNAEAGDRVLVSVSNHQATVIGNITFPPSARKEDQAIESANGALNQSNQAMEKAKDAQTKASSAITDSSVASALANEAKTESAKAQEAANTAIQNAGEAKQLAQASSDKSDETQQLVNQVKDSVTAANKDISALKTEVKTANDNIASVNTKLDTQAGEIATIKETYSTKVETESTKADLTTEISKQVGALQTTVEKNFATKTESVALEKKLQTQITQNADSISSTVTKVEKLESDTTEQQKNIGKALSDAQAAQKSADSANITASNAKTAADTAQKAADTATANAASAQKAADLANEKVTAADKNLQSAKTDLKEAQENLKNVTSRVDATEQEITDAKQKVDVANTNVTKALTDVAEANAAANKANEVASKAQGEATAANKAASDAQTKAADAQQVATNAQQAADKAQSDLAELTNRVTTAETKITQTNEAITTQASRITETSNKIDGIQNDITNNYYSKEQTDAQIKVSADKITQSVSEVNKVATSANSKIDNLQIGGRNLLKNSHSVEQTYSYPSSNYVDQCDWVTSIPLNGDTYTLSFLAKSTVAGDIIRVHFYSPSNITHCVGSQGQVSDNKDGQCDFTLSTTLTKYWVTYTIPKGGNSARSVIIPRMFSDFGKGTVSVKWEKLEEGNKATDWTPAPEDQEQYVNDKIAASEKTTEESYKTLIDQTKNDISALVQKVQKETDANSTSISEMSTNFKVTVDGLSATKSAVQTLIDAVNGTVSKEELQQYIRWNGDCLELGNSAQPFKCKLSNTELAFYQNTDKVAWITNKELYILKAIIAQSIGCGNFLFVDEGDLGFSLI